MHSEKIARVVSVGWVHPRPVPAQGIKQSLYSPCFLIFPICVQKERQLFRPEFQGDRVSG
jgi:hypothetical protein